MLVNDKLEAALVALITPAVAALVPVPDVVPGKDSGDKTLNVVICDAQGEGEEDPKGTGNFFLDAEIEMRSTAVPNETAATPATPDPKIANQAMVTAVTTVIMVDNLPALLSAAVPNFTVFPNGIIFKGPGRRQDETGAWIDTLGLRAYCCGSSIPA